MTENVETRIRERAHGIWESEGRPDGRAEAHWLMATAELTAKAAKPKATRRAPAAAAPKRRAAATVEA